MNWRTPAGNGEPPPRLLWTSAATPGAALDRPSAGWVKIPEEAKRVMYGEAKLAGAMELSGTVMATTFLAVVSASLSAESLGEEIWREVCSRGGAHLSTALHCTHRAAAG